MSGRPKKISSHEFFVKLGTKIISILSLKTREGSCFNVDTRLRPSGSAGPLVVSRAALLKYHRAPTAVWERQAMIKARPIAGDIGFGAGVLGELDEILYSKPLTRVDISEMLRIRERMEVEIAKESGTRYNVKAGRGGLVDIEFLVQALQLRYGREADDLRNPSTLEALGRLKEAAIIKDADYRTLKDAYAFLKLLEMRLRIVHDRPEGVLVPGSPEIDGIAGLAGLTGQKLLEKYLDSRERVRALYLKTLEGLIEGP